MSNTQNKIKNPQIFVMFLPGMYGTFITNILMYHDLLYNKALDNVEFLPRIDSEIKEEAKYNSHNGPYKDMIPGFHGRHDLDQLHSKTYEELKKYFEPLRNTPLGVHRLADYFDLDLEKFFEKTLRIIMIPESMDDLEIWAERSKNAAPTDFRGEYWFPLLEKKGVENLPDYLVQGLRIKERYKYLKELFEHFNTHKSKAFENKNCIYFDPKNISSLTKVQNLMDEACDNLGISRFVVPEDKITSFVKTNSIFLDKFND
jgi:hypothetical protein